MTNVRSGFVNSTLGTAARSIALPLTGGALLCAAWLQLRIHSGVGHRLTGASHLRGRAAEQELVLLLFISAAVAIFAARHALARAFLRLASLSELRPVDPLAAPRRPREAARSLGGDRALGRAGARQPSRGGRAGAGLGGAPSPQVRLQPLIA